MDNLTKAFSFTRSEEMGQAIEDMVSQAVTRRRNHEKRWYDNNYFDDGFHFRVISKKTGRVIDHVNKGSGYIERAIPRASRQIRGVSNLLFAAEPYPVVYPERISTSQFPKILDPQTQQEIPSPEYEQALKQSKEIAKKRGIWLSTEWEDNQHLPIKLIDMLLLAAKNSVSYLQIYSDTDRQKIITEVLDAFDVILFGDKRELQQVPFITKASSMDIKEAMVSPLFEEARAAKLTPDNKYATSEIKDAYMRARYGTKTPGKKDEGSIIIKETFIKEFLNDNNWQSAVKKDAGGAMEGKSKGDMVMRHLFSAGGITLRDEYIDYDKYPFADFRFEPGALYQVPFIERFIPQNKSLDIIVTRLEKWINSMVVGVWQQRKGENMQIGNFPGGYKVEYETTPLTQANIGNPGATPFNVVELLNKFIDEQGATTAGGVNVPPGVKSGVAIESVKATEYANLKISTLMLKETIKNIAECMMERAHKDFLNPQEVESIEDGEPKYFDVIGQKGYELSKTVGKDLPNDVVPIRKGVKVRIEIEPGLGLTMEGKKEAMKSIIDYMLQLAEGGYINQEALKMVVKRFMETFGYGSTQEFMETLESGQGDITEDTIMKMKIAIVEALKDSGAVGPEAEQRLVDSTKLGVVETLKDTGLLNKIQDNPELDAIPYKDAPEDIKRQMEAKAGLRPSETISPAGTEQITKTVNATRSKKETNVQ